MAETLYNAKKSVYYEVGTRYQINEFSLQSAVFHTDTRDMQLYSRPLGSQSLNNAGKAAVTGVELIGKWQFTPGWSWDISGNYVRSTFDSDGELYDNNKVPFVPCYSASTSLNGTIGTRFGALIPRLAGSHCFDGDNNTLRQERTTSISLFHHMGLIRLKESNARLMSMG
ncbi:MAG: TonB-dependent receptor domain-containing protein [Candidatus Malihini olakiniferum]